MRGPVAVLLTAALALPAAVSAQGSPPRPAPATPPASGQ